MTSPPGSLVQPPARRKRPGLRIAVIVACTLLALVVVAGVVGAVIVNGYISDAPPMPSREALWTVRRSPGMTFLDRNGKHIATRGAKYGEPVKLAQLPAYVPRAFLAAEDRRFYQHGPIDFQAIARAIETNFRKQRSAEGASTLTQQLARTLFLKREQSLKRKVQEAYLAWELEQGMSKDEILELYLNRTYFGDGAYGLEAASQTYFGKPASQLSLTEAAVLAGLPNAPSRLALTNDMQGAVARGHHVLETMRGEGWINDADLTTALATTPVLYTAPHVGEGDEGYVLDEAAAEAAPTRQRRRALTWWVKTTIDPALQTLGTATLRDVIAKEGAHRSVSQGALVTLAPDGAILAMVGGLDHDKSPFNRVVPRRTASPARRSRPSSTARWSAAANPTDIRQDAPIQYAGWNPASTARRWSAACSPTSARTRRSATPAGARKTMATAMPAR